MGIPMSVLICKKKKTWFELSHVVKKKKEIFLFPVRLPRSPNENWIVSPEDTVCQTLSSSSFVPALDSGDDTKELESQT